MSIPLRKIGLAVTGAFAGLSLLPAAAQAQGNPEAGHQVFRQNCRSCHQIDPDARGEGGPNLALLGTGPAGVDKSFAYSPAFKAAVAKGLHWDAHSLDAFLKSPSAVVPGGAMPVSVPDDQQRADVIAYLRSLKH
jgi:cytochrome c